MSACVLSLPEEDFERRTRCPAWNVKELLAHLYRDFEQIAMFLAVPAPDRADADAVSYWGTYDPVAEAPGLADRAKMRAAAYGAGHQLALVWSWMWPRVLDDARGQSGDKIVATWGPGMVVEEMLKTRLVEVAIHGLDIAAALDRDPWLAPDAATAVRDILARRLEGSVDPGWDDVTFIEKLTDRQPLTDEDRRVLGDAAKLIPVLG